MTRSVGTDYDLIISKNTLKRGYVHPERPVEAQRLLGLGIDDGHFVKALYDALKPGGRVMIYNICPAPSPAGSPYKPWADGRCPFAEEVWKSAGFRVVAFDRDDSKDIREVARVLGWDKGESPIDLKTDLFAQYSLMEKPAQNEPGKAAERDLPGAPRSSGFVVSRAAGPRRPVQRGGRNSMCLCQRVEVPAIASGLPEEEVIAIVSNPGLRQHSAVEMRRDVIPPAFVVIRNDPLDCRPRHERTPREG